MITILNQQNSVLSNLLVQIRDEKIQQDRVRFRHNMVKIGEILAYEISKDLDYTDKAVQTPLARSHEKVISDQIVLATILRAGLIMQEGMVSLLTDTETAFVSAFRKEGNKENIEVVVEYLASPNIEDKTLIIADPMIATGKSSLLSYQALLKRGQPKKVYFACAIGSKEGVDYLQNNIPEANIYCAALDPELNENAYIVPGLGDAGDLAFGQKD